MNTPTPPEAPAGAPQPRRVRGAGYQMEFKSGQLCLVQFEVKGQRYKASVIGMDAYKFLALRLPMAPGIQTRLRPGGTMLVRMEQGGTVYAFTSEILSSVLRPAPVAFIVYPQVVEGLQFREHKRTRCMLPATVKGQHLQSTGLVTDISLGGCRVVVDWRDKDRVFNIMTGDSLELGMNLDDSGAVPVPSLLKSVKETKRHYTLGLQFSEEHRLKPLAHFIGRLESAWAAIEEDAVSGS